MAFSTMIEYARQRFSAGAAFVLVMLFIGAGNGCTRPSSGGPPPKLTVQIGGRTFHLELALEETSRYQGLSDRRHVNADGGMLFAFSRPQELQFVMRRCHVPLDLITLDPGGRVVSVHHEMEPQPGTPESQLRRYSSSWPAQFAIELRGGTVRELGLKRTEKIDLPLNDLKRWAR